MNYREIRARLIASYGKFVFFPSDPEIPKIISTNAFTHLVLGEDIVVYAQKAMEEELEEELQENYDVVYENPKLEGEYFVSPHANTGNINFKFKNGAEILSRAMRKPFEEELEIIENLSNMINKALAEFWNEIKIGMRENEAKAVLDCKLMKEGVEGFTYPTILVSGKRSRHLLPKSSEKKIERGEIIYIDSSPHISNYPLNFSRVIFTEERREWVDALERINEMYSHLSPIIMPGANCNFLDRAIRKIGNFPHYSVMPSGGFYMPYAPGDCVLEENMVMSIVPSIHLEEGVIRVKRNVIVKKDSPKFLV